MKPRILFLATVIIASWFLACGFIFGAEPPTFVASTDGKTICLTPQVAAGTGVMLRITATGPNKFAAILVTANGSQPTILDFAGAVTFGISPPQPPGPIPPVPPPPVPTPIVKPAWIGVIHESRDATPATANVRDAKAWKDAATAAGIQWIVMDKDEAVKKFPGATKRAVAFGLPAVVSVEASGICTVDKLPATIDAMTTLVRAKGGAK